MDFFTAGIVITIVAEVFIMILSNVFSKPKLKIRETWVLKKTVYKMERENKPRFISIPIVIPSLLVTTKSSTSEEIYPGENVSDTDEIFVSGGDFHFYGITVENSGDSILFSHRKSANITKTHLVMDDGRDIECRWWSRDYSESDKLFATDKIELKSRKIFSLSPGEYQHIVIASRADGSSAYQLFDIVSDVGGNFWDNKYPLSEFPKYAKLLIHAGSSITNMELKFSIDANKKLLITKL